MRRLVMTFAYDGSGFAGLQRQQNADRTVQAVLEDTLRHLLHENVILHASGRTDSGVHALRQVAHFDIQAPIPVERLTYALSRSLPPDIAVYDMQEAAPDFHARKSAIAKAYAYYIYNGRPAPAIGHQYFTYEPMPVDRLLFTESFAPMLGYHDFRGFCGRGSSIDSYDRKLYIARVVSEDDWIAVLLIGNGFLRKMVRNLVGSALDIATGRKPTDIIERALASGDRRQAGTTAPANGLYLDTVYYDPTHLARDLHRASEAPLSARPPVACF